MRGFYIAQQETPTTYRAFAFKNSEAAQHFIAAHRLHGVRRGYAARGRRLGPVEDLRDYDPEIEELRKEHEKLILEALAMTATQLDPLATVRLTEGNGRPAAPKASATTAAPRSAAHQEVIELRAEVRTLHAEIERLNAVSATAFESMQNSLMSISASVAYYKHAGEMAQPPAPAAQPDAHGNGYVTFMAETIVMTYNDAGEPRYKVKGGRYAKFGVNLWPEALAALGVKAADLKPGPNAFGKMVRAELGETTNAETGEKSMVARKVVGLAE